MKRFQRKIEDFVCQNCGEKITGNGFTNHCPFCLYSLHIDINPGDRAADCRGLMEPESVEGKVGEYILLHRCLKCDYRKRNKVAKDDDMDRLLEIVKNRQGLE